MRKLGFALFVAATVAALPLPAAAQMAGNAGLAFAEAVKHSDGNKAQELLAANTPGIVNARDGDGNTPLIIAVARSDPEWTGFLLNQGADPNIAGKNGDTPLIVAARFGFGQGVEWLLGMGAKVNATNKMGETALITAVVQRQTPIVRELLQAGADPDKTDTAAGYSARDYARRDTRARGILQLIEAKKPGSAAAR